jgi:heme A synthase
MEFVSKWLYRCAVIAAAFTFLTILAGALVTTEREAPLPPELPVKIHLGLAVVAAALLAALAIWLVAAGWRALGAFLLVLVAAAGAAGEFQAAISHAILAQILFAIAVAAAVCSSKSCQQEPDIILDRGWPSLRSMASAAPVLVLAQVALGAAYRHKAMGLTWHIVGAMVIVLTILIVGMCVMQACGKHRALRPAGIALLIIALTQLLLGMATLTTEMLAPDNTAPLPVILSTVAHVAVGAATLAASLVLAIQVRRNVQKPAEEAEEQAAGA